MSEEIKKTKLSEFFSKDCFCFWLCIVIGIIIAIIGGIFFVPLYGDSITYAMATRQISTGEVTGMCMYSNPPILPYLGALISNAGIEPHVACYIGGSSFYVLSALPLYYILRFFFDIKYSSIGCLIYMTCSEVIMACSIGMLESGFVFLLLLSISILFGFFKKKTVFKLSALGVSLGLLFLVRNESFAFVLLLFFCFILMNLREYKYCIKKTFIKSTLLYIACILVPLFIVITPRCIQVYEKSGYFAVTSRQGEHMDKIMKLIKN